MAMSTEGANEALEDAGKDLDFSGKKIAALCSVRPARDFGPPSLMKTGVVFVAA